MKYQLADLLAVKREEIVQRFEAAARRAGASEALPNEIVINSLRDFIDELAVTLREAEHHEESGGTFRSASATEHGKQRFSVGYDIGALVREYGVLRDVIYDVIEESGEEISHCETRLIFRRIFDAAADATAKYSAEHGEELRKKTAEHIAFLAHELRNPLSSVRLAFAIMRDRGDIKAVRAADLMDRGLRQLNELIDDSLVTVSLRDSRNRHDVAIDVGNLLTAIAEESEADVEMKSISLRVEAAARLRGDMKALRSAISNLVRNAVKFTHSGGTIALRAKEAEGRVIIEVEDACGGLPDGKLDKLFDPFVQVGLDRSGFGLGLAIAKQAAEAHDGQLRVHNVPGRGCVFVLDLPAR